MGNSPEMKDLDQLLPKEEIYEKSKCQIEAFLPTCSEPSNSRIEQENKVLHEEVAQKTSEPKNWFKKMLKKTKNKSAKKQKVKVLAF